MGSDARSNDRKCFLLLSSSPQISFQNSYSSYVFDERISTTQEMGKVHRVILHFSMIFFGTNYLKSSTLLSSSLDSNSSKMPPKQVWVMVGWDEDKSLRSVVHVRDIIWNGPQIGVWNVDLLSFLRSPVEFIPSEVTTFKEAKERYEALAQSKLVRPILKVLRSREVGPIGDEDLASVVTPTLAIFAAIFLAVKHVDRPTQRPLKDWEALLSASTDETKMLKEADLGKYLSPFACILDPPKPIVVEKVVEKIVEKLVLENGRGGRGGTNQHPIRVGEKRERECYLCHETGHFARECPKQQLQQARGGKQ